MSGLPYGYKPKVPAAFRMTSNRASRLGRLSTGEISLRIGSLPGSDRALLMRDIEAADMVIKATENALHMATVRRIEAVADLERKIANGWSPKDRLQAKIII